MCLNMSKDYSYQAVSHEYLRNGRGKQYVSFLARNQHATKYDELIQNANPILT